MTPLLSEIRERLKRATPGPWKGDRHDGSVKYALIGDGERKVLSLDSEAPGFFSFYDEEFIRHSRADIEALLEMIEEKDDALKVMKIVALKAGAAHKAPCAVCRYNGPGYFQPETHECIRLLDDAEVSDRTERGGPDAKG